MEDDEDFRKEEIMWNCCYLPLHYLDIFFKKLIGQFSFITEKNERKKKVWVTRRDRVEIAQGC